MSKTHLVLTSQLAVAAVHQLGHGGGYNSAPRQSCELGPGFLSPRSSPASNGHESGVKLTLSVAPYMRWESVVVGSQQVFFGGVLFGPFRITNVNPRGTIG